MLRSGSNIPTQRIGARVRDKKNLESRKVKQRELRQLETKLKKWEEDLKLQDAKSSSKNDDSRQLEDYLQKTEARNVELEATVRTLQRKICLLEKKKFPDWDEYNWATRYELYKL